MKHLLLILIAFVAIPVLAASPLETRVEVLEASDASQNAQLLDHEIRINTTENQVVGLNSTISDLAISLDETTVIVLDNQARITALEAGSGTGPKFGDEVFERFGTIPVGVVTGVVDDTVEILLTGHIPNLTIFYNQATDIYRGQFQQVARQFEPCGVGGPSFDSQLQFDIAPSTSGANPSIALRDTVNQLLAVAELDDNPVTTLPDPENFPPDGEFVYQGEISTSGICQEFSPPATVSTGVVLFTIGPQICCLGLPFSFAPAP